ncbi:hypothetical protein LYNGBM3L_68180 [Moorena producens 3L]|uniref:Uncharacterized protein n=1 Tax=Moorena producens 3L TaxID=489825 RepID=F4Y2N9_9CYAN|nr:hypothetical protein LYNGBM3L_68180 [Moorena producens 3L]
MLGEPMSQSRYPMVIGFDQPTKTTATWIQLSLFDQCGTYRSPKPPHQLTCTALSN